ncbi:MAG: TIGR03936 family radical SAM-associated protein [Phycisphaerae bacterium]|nr:TIGR03936 family radical SAM-associated protein [Phycisphaerae bacterium]
MEIESRCIGLLITFSIGENLRFLSHAEAVRLWQRAIDRSGIRLTHSRGFNPRPKLSLPLPRSVGVESDCDVVFAEMSESADIDGMRLAVEGQLPHGCRIVGIESVEKRKAPQPVEVEYCFEVAEGSAGEVGQRAEDVMASENLAIERIAPKGKNRQIDVRQFIEDMAIDKNKVTVLCKVSNDGTIRIEEMLGLLGVEHEQLQSPVRRTRIVWN